MDTASRIDTLEDELGNLRKDFADQQDLLRDIRQALSNLTQHVPPPVPPIVTPTPAPPVHTASGPSLKPASPNEFNGARDKGRAFLNSCELYMHLVPRQFADDAMRIGWTLSFMKQGRASLFADRTLRYQAKHGVLPYADWAAFRSEFTDAFCPRNEGQNALTRLETEDFHQGRRSVDKYTDEFRDLIELARYTDGLIIVMKYRRGLAPEIQSQVATMTTGRPADDQPKEWYRAAALCDENRRTNAAFVATKSSHTARTTAPAARPSPQPFRAPPAAFAQTYQRTAAPVPTSALPPGIPMDIDAARRKPADTTTCYRCGKTGHQRRDCPRQYDVRFMTDDERSDIAQQALAELDVRAVAMPEGEEKAEQEAVEEEEDFVSRSG